jgi:GH24 family phage-related lysozyme (muramidase)
MFSNFKIVRILYNSSIIFGVILLPSTSYNNSLADSIQTETHQQVFGSANNNNIRPKTNIVASDIAVLPATINLVKQFEGFSPQAYLDTSGLPVVGYGQTKIHGKTVRMGQYITQAQADVALQQELAHLQKMVKSYVEVDLNPHQLGALTSLVFNAGSRILTNSTLIRKLNAGDYEGAAKEFPRWNKANKGGRLVVFPGLTRRRIAEQQLFLTPYQQVASN